LTSAWLHVVNVEALMNVNPVASSSYTSQLSSGSTDKAHQAPPPPPQGAAPGEGGFINAIGSALESLGVTDVAANDKESAAASLGSFLHQLMTSLHEQGGASEAPAESADGSASAGKQGAQGGPAGPGRLAQDLKSLIASLQGDSSDPGSASSALDASFSSLLESLGADSSDSKTKLASFLQTLADKLPQGGSSGSLINTTA
jgi:hypothetical protein